MKVWTAIRNFVQANDVKVLLGTHITCNEDDDATDWFWTKELAKFLGPRYLMGVAIGNELDILSEKNKRVLTEDCIEKLWEGGRFWHDFGDRVRDLDALGMGSVPVTTVFTAAAAPPDSPYFFEAHGRALVHSFLVNATRTFGSRFVFTFNIYPYFDPNYILDGNTTDQCQSALKVAECWAANCSVPDAVANARRKADRLMNGTRSVLWIGETGWSSPKATTLGTNMAACPLWSSQETLQKFYSGFLEWDLESPDTPDHVFYFTPRDSLNFGILEHFGLIDHCLETRCKLRSPGYTTPQRRTVVEKEQGLPWMSLTLLRISGCAAALAACILLGAWVSKKVAEARSLHDKASVAHEAEGAEVGCSAPTMG